MYKNSIYLFVWFMLGTASLFGQSKDRNSREIQYFLKYLRKQVFRKEDSVEIAKYLSNKSLFTGLLLANLDHTKVSFDESEKDYIAKQIMNDRLILDVGEYISSESTNVKEDSKRVIKLSVPIFLKAYKYCILSHEVPYWDQQRTVLYGKKKGYWSVIASLGGVYNY